MKIPFHRTTFSNEEIKNVAATLNSGWWTSGPKTIELEEKFKNFTGSKEAIAVNSCTSALHLALIALDISQGDEVILPANTFSSTAQAILYIGAKPVIADINKDDSLISIDDIRKKISKKTKAIIAVDFAGQPADYLELKSVNLQTLGVWPLTLSSSNHTENTA